MRAAQASAGGEGAAAEDDSAEPMFTLKSLKSRGALDAVAEASALGAREMEEIDADSEDDALVRGWFLFFLPCPSFLRLPGLTFAAIARGRWRRLTPRKTSPWCTMYESHQKKRTFWFGRRIVGSCQ